MSRSKFVYVTYIRITETVARTDNSGDNKTVSVRNERRRRMEGRRHLENVC